MEMKLIAKIREFFHDTRAFVDVSMVTVEIRLR